MSQATTVKASNSRWEVALLIAGVVGMLAATGFYVLKYGRSEQVQEIQPWQVSAYSDLGVTDQAIYNALVTAQEDIAWIQYAEGPWPNIATLEDFLVAPFARDFFWENNGQLEWGFRDVVQEGEMQGYTMYHGNNGTIEGQSAYILVIGHLHAGNNMANHNTIWVHDNPQQGMPKTSTQQSLILEGWKNVVPYTGKNEMERLQD